MTGPRPQFDHERYEELCALVTAGALTTEESEALFAHLDECAECSKVFAQYQSLANEGMPLLADLRRPTPEAVEFDETPALARLLESTKNVKPDAAPPRFSPARFVPAPVWRGLVAASLVIGVAFASYKVGEQRHGNPIQLPRPNISQAADTSNERRNLEAALQGAQQREADLQALVSARSADIEKLRTGAKTAQERLDNLTASLTASKSDTATQVATLTGQRDATTARLRDAEQSYQSVQDELSTLRSQRKQDQLRLASLEQQVNGLTLALNDQNTRTRSDEQYLASDKDIRDLIGARNLYIADIMDVNETGQSRKPFGRVFYTKTKSLIFYAYDLDRQPGVKQTSTFHVWGRTSANDKQPINLGLLYMDSETNRRWTLRVDDPEQLARLDAVFVTIEPGKQIEKPSGKPFLYASLRREPNHP
jgi:predicted  nucleic acid-binding Zn-ribbon protein